MKFNTFLTSRISYILSAQEMEHALKNLTRSGSFVTEWIGIVEECKDSSNCKGKSAFLPMTSF